MISGALAAGLLLFGPAGAARKPMQGPPTHAPQARLPVLAFPEPGVDDPAAYQGYQTRFYRDSKDNAVQIYLEPRGSRVVLVWADAANESVGFTVRDASGRPARLGWAAEEAEVSDRARLAPLNTGSPRRPGSRSAGSCSARCGWNATSNRPASSAAIHRPTVPGGGRIAAGCDPGPATGRGALAPARDPRRRQPRGAPPPARADADPRRDGERWSRASSGPRSTAATT